MDVHARCWNSITRFVPYAASERKIPNAHIEQETAPLFLHRRPSRRASRSGRRPSSPFAPAAYREVNKFGIGQEMHPPLTLHRHPMCAEIIQLFQKCHADHPVGKFFGKCTELKINLDRCFREEKAIKRKANFENSKKSKERLQAYRKEMAEKIPE